MEIWKPLPNYENLYEVSNLGNVRGVDRILTRPNGVKIHWKGKPRIALVSSSGYRYCMLSKNGCNKHVQIHRAVAMAFIPNPQNKTQVNHKDCNKLNDCVDNLEWCTPQENTIHAHQNNLIDTSKTSHKGKLNGSAHTVYQIDKSTHKLINVFDTVKDASIQTNTHYSDICNCCHGYRKTANGFIWSYHL